MLNFNHSVYFLFLLLLFPVIYLQFFSRNRGGRFSFPFKVWNGEGFNPPVRHGKVWIYMTTILSLLGMILLVAALADPVITRKKQVYSNKGIDIIFVVDQSPSMAATDFPPINRFETARNMIQQFVEERKNDSVGFVGFGDDAVLHVPPTIDYRFFLSRLEELQVMDLGEGTAIGMGLAVAVLHLSKSSAEEKVIVLLTDGDNNAGEIQPLTSSEIASELGIRIYCIGIGSEGDVPVEIVNPQTGKLMKGLLKSRFDEKLLSSIANKTGGGYYKAVSPGILESIFQTIDSLETREKKVQIKVETLSLTVYFVLAGALFILLAYFIRKIIMGEIL